MWEAIKKHVFSSVQKYVLQKKLQSVTSRAELAQQTQDIESMLL